MPARLIAVSAPRIEGVTSADDLIAYVCRVSNPSNQQNGTRPDRLIKYCIEHEHWSVFETASMTVEVETTRAIAAQVLRHRSFCFQEFSQRYAVMEFDPEPQAGRSPDPKNRQASHDDLPEDVKSWWEAEQRRMYDELTELYVRALEKGIAKECARHVLPLATPTRLYMTGNARSFIHYIQLRTGNGTQKEHADLALEIKAIFVDQFPLVSKALGWA